MGSSITKKILQKHFVSGSLTPGESLDIRIDQTLTQDATGTMAYLQFEALGLDRVRNELAVSYVDHNTVQVGFENADDHRYLQSVAAKKGVVFSRPGNGICHQVHLERFGQPGKTLLGSDSHTPTGGGLGMIAIGAGGLDVALAMAGVPFTIIAPSVIRITLKNSLRPFVSAKDVILKVLEHFTTKGNVNCIFEYAGEGVKTLSVPERATICNMGAECGVTCSLFPSDEITRDFLRAQHREECWVPLEADEDAEYDGEFEIDLAALEPLTACPHSPGNIKKVSELSGMKVDQVLIGSCTNSSYQDLVKVGMILDGHHVAENVSLGIAPGSREVFEMISEDGTLTKMIKAGARILESACGFCIGNHFSPSTDGVSLRTNNRNFEGRSGTKSGQVYLVSPETAAVSAITGVFTSPLEQDFVKDIVNVNASDFHSDDSMFIFPPADGSGVEILRGPNIGEPPKNTPLAENLAGQVAIKVGDKITTDHIMPAGARLKYRSNIPLYSTFVFEGVDKEFHTRCSERRDRGVANFIVAGQSYGQGSSREHAALCPMYLGVKAVLALSIERIHQANLCNAGILPLTLLSEDDYEKISADDALMIKDAVKQVASGELITVDNVTKAYSFKCRLSVTELQREMLLKGGRLNQIKETLA
ncbi:MAG: aconitate hydratase [Bullifex sp.]